MNVSEGLMMTAMRETAHMCSYPHSLSFTCFKPNIKSFASLKSTVIAEPSARSSHKQMSSFYWADIAPSQMDS